MGGGFLLTAAAALTQIPFVEGLTSVQVATSDRGDYETLRVIRSITDKSYAVVITGEVPADDDAGFITASVPRRVRFTDQLHSRKLRLAWHTMDRESMTGNVPGISCDIFHELRNSGFSDISFLEMVGAAGFPMNIPYDGRVTIVDRNPVSMIVNGNPVSLPVLHVKGSLRNEEDKRLELELIVLDNRDNPLILEARIAERRMRAVRIDYPLPEPALESALAGAAPVQLSGVHFGFASATLRPESDAVLTQLAAVLRAHPDWRFRIDGHTDSIGDPAANLELSRKRTVSVRAALVERFGVNPLQLTTMGFGESKPLDGNESEVGRARNRRVELVRLSAAPAVSTTAVTAHAAPARSACPNSTH
jgi:outer membrane protein OmpA-like peptidoglycan-associated protein